MIKKNMERFLCAFILCIQASSYTTVSAEPKHVESRFGYLHPAIDARVDSVWRAIPGLSGWQLNEQLSQKRTLQMRDGRTHLVWEIVPPAISVKTLPPEPIYRGPYNRLEKPISLMVNVSWGEEYIPSMLQTFAKENVHATFFLDGAWVLKHPLLTEQIVQSGHAIGSHGSGHPDFRKLNSEMLINQIEQTNSRIRKITGNNVDLIAPPSGAFDTRFVRLAHAHHMYTILWTADTVDWKKPDSDVIVRRVAQRATPGAFILMHPTQNTAIALPKMIANLRAHGYTFKTVEDVVQEKSLVSPAEVIQETP